MIGNFRGGFQLFGGDSSAQNRGTDVRISRLLLGMYSHVVAIGVFGNLFGLRRIQFKSNALVQLGEEGICRPAVIQKKKFQARSLATVAEHFALAKNLSDASDDLYRLMRRDERVQANGQMRFGGKSASHA